jgi:hypothetical protein
MMFTALVKNLEKLLAQRREETEKNREENIYCPLTRTTNGFQEVVRKKFSHNAWDGRTAANMRCG